MNNNYFFPPSVAIEVNILQSNITTETMDNERIGSVAIEFTCPYSLMGDIGERMISTVEMSGECL